MHPSPHIVNTVNFFYGGKKDQDLFSAIFKYKMPYYYYALLLLLLLLSHFSRVQLYATT